MIGRKEGRKEGKEGQEGKEGMKQRDG